MRPATSPASRQVDAEPVGDAARELFVHVAKVGDHARRHLLQFYLGKLEGKGRGDMRPLAVGLRFPEQPGVAIVIGEQLRADG